MATDGQVDTNDSSPGKNLPPWMKQKQKPNNDKIAARKGAIQDRLAKMSGKKK